MQVLIPKYGLEGSIYLKGKDNDASPLAFVYNPEVTILSLLLLRKNTTTFFLKHILLFLSIGTVAHFWGVKDTDIRSCGRTSEPRFQICPTSETSCTSRPAKCKVTLVTSHILNKI